MVALVKVVVPHAVDAGMECSTNPSTQTVAALLLAELRIAELGQPATSTPTERLRHAWRRFAGLDPYAPTSTTSWSTLHRAYASTAGSVKTGSRFSK